MILITDVAYDTILQPVEVEEDDDYWMLEIARIQMMECFHHEKYCHYHCYLVLSLFLVHG